jgi:predicted nucleic acid-binding protein
MTTPNGNVVYWDTSAIISSLFRDQHSMEASAVANETGTHLISSLAWAETNAVIARIERDRSLAAVLVAAAREALETGPWTRVNIDPAWPQIATLACAWPLRGADLWHLAAAKALQVELPELRLLSFDVQLVEAARGEQLCP